MTQSTKATETKEATKVKEVTAKTINPAVVINDTIIINKGTGNAKDGTIDIETYQVAVIGMSNQYITVLDPNGNRITFLMDGRTGVRFKLVSRKMRSNEIKAEKKAYLASVATEVARFDADINRLKNFDTDAAYTQATKDGELVKALARVGVKPTK